MEDSTQSRFWELSSHTAVNSLKQPQKPDETPEIPGDMVTTMGDRHKGPSRSATGGVKKTSSSPNVRTIVIPENANLSPNDKKRNKLGYHRTAVACGHCRRRKIRCIPSSDNNASKCQNCVRLKKDCQFFPVDQNLQPNTKRPRSESKIDFVPPDSENSVSSSSPSVPIGAGWGVSKGQIGTSPIPPADSGFGTGVGQEYDQNQPFASSYWHNHPQRYIEDQRSGLEPPSPPYWTSQDTGQPSPFAQSPYPITPVTTSALNTSQEAPYTYPAPPLTNHAYPFSHHTGRDIHASPSSHAINQYGLYRPQTMPELDRNMGVGGVQRDTVPIPTSQQMMTLPYNSLHHNSQYQSGMHQNWTSLAPEQGQIPASYAPAGAGTSWFSSVTGMGQGRENNHDGPMFSPQRMDATAFRPNPG